MLMAGAAAALSIVFIWLGGRRAQHGSVARLRALDSELEHPDEDGAERTPGRRSYMALLELPYRLMPASLRARMCARLEPLCDAPSLSAGRLAGICVYATLGLPVAVMMLTRFSTAGLALAPVLAAFGLLLPRIIASRAKARHVEAVRRDLPDTADMLYAYVLGGKNLDQAFKGAARFAPEPLGPFLLHSVREMELGSTREESFERLGVRCPVSELRSLLRSLLEAERRGYPLSASLDVFSREIRLRRRDQLREAGAKAPLKMLAPLIFMILPASVLLTVGPTFLATLQRVF
jgi:Flp pilus assembly protein TadB